jgi:hypothetical protein
MCFEWDKRYFREQEALRISKEKTDELVKRAEEAANAAAVADKEKAEA